VILIHYLGFYYEEIEKNYEESVKYLKIEKNYEESVKYLSFS